MGRPHSIRAHVNPLGYNPNYANPTFGPTSVKWEQFFPASATVEPPTIADIGCGFGGLLEAISPHCPNSYIVGMEIRIPVVKKVEERIAMLQRQGGENKYLRIGVIYTNVMKYFAKFFQRHQLEKIFFLFPDPHFKKSTYRRRVISPALLSEYAYAVRPGGLAYNCTDVFDLHSWTVAHFDAHPLWDRVSDEELNSDPMIDCIHQTDEAKKVARNNGSKYFAVYRRLPDPH